MLLAGLQKTSLIDFPGKISCVVFTTGCNFHCPYCHNPELAKGAFPTQISLESFEAFISKRRSLLDAVVISGGEPTLSPDLVALCQICHDVGLLVKIDTNGSHPEILESLIEEKHVDYIAMDIKANPERYVDLTRLSRISDTIAASLHLILTRCSHYEFRTTCVRPFIDETVIRTIGALIQGARLYALQTFRGDHVLDQGFSSIADHGFTPSEMARLQTIAASYVEKCIVR